MKLLKSLYIIWVVFWTIGAILAYFVAYNATFIGVLFHFILTCLFPLTPYFFTHLIYKIRITKNILIYIIYLCILLFIFVFYYLSLYYFFDAAADFLIYLVATIIFFAIAYVVWKDKAYETNNQ